MPKATAAAHDNTTPPTTADEPHETPRPSAAQPAKPVAEHAAQPPPIEPRKTVARRVLAELHRARADDARAEKLRNEELMKRLQPATGTLGRGFYGRGIGGLGLRGTGSGSGTAYGTVHGSGHASRGGGGAGVGLLGMLSDPRKTTLQLLSVRGPLAHSQISWKLRASLAVRACAQGNAWATFDLTIDKGAVTRAHVRASQPGNAKFRSCTEHILGQLRFASAAKTVVRATLRVKAKKP